MLLFDDVIHQILMKKSTTMSVLFFIQSQAKNDLILDASLFFLRSIVY